HCGAPRNPAKRKRARGKEFLPRDCAQKWVPPKAWRWRHAEGLLSGGLLFLRFWQRKRGLLAQKTGAERTRCRARRNGGTLWTGGRDTAERRKRMAQKRNGSLRDLQRTTDLLSSLLAKEAKALDARRRAEGAGDMKALKEITAVLKDLAAVARS